MFVDKLRDNLKEWYYKINNHNPKKILIIQNYEYLEDVLKKEKLL